MVGLATMGTVAASTKRDLGLWESVLALGEGEYAVERADEVAVVARQLAQGFVLDQESADLVRKVYRNLLSLNLEKLYGMLPSSQGDARWLGMEGSATSDGYALTLMAKEPKRESADVGVLAGWLEMVPIEERYGTGTPYAVDQRLEVGTGGVGPQDLERFITGLLVQLERAVDTPQPEWASQAARAAEPRLKGGDSRLLSSIYAAMPKGASALTDVVRVRGLGTQIPCGQGHCLAYNIDVMLDPDGVRRAGFRHLGEAIRRWENLAKAQARIRLPSGADVAHLVVRTDPAGLRLRFLSQGGRIVPVKGGEVVMEEAFLLKDLDQAFEIEVRADVQYEGFSLEIRGLRFPGRLTANHEELRFLGQINDTPRLSLSGTDAVRSSLASLADSTLGLGDHGRDFARYVAEGRSGQGTSVQLRLAPSDGGGHVLTEAVDTVLLDNSLIRFAFRVVGGRLIPKQEAISDLGSLLEQLIVAMVTDYEAVRPELAER